MKKTVFLLVLMLITHFSVFSQPQNQDLNNAIQRFKNTEFMVKYMDLKGQIEDEAEDFIAHQNKYTTKDRRRVQLSYDKTAARFNQLMLDIKQDFLDKQKIKMINKYPQMYSDGLTNKINELDRFYKENFQLTYTEVTTDNGSAILALIFELIKSSGELSGYFKGLKYEKNAMSESYIEKNLIEPSKLTSWAELARNTTVLPASETPKKQVEIETSNDKNNEQEGDKERNNQSEDKGNTTENNNTNEGAINDKKVEVEENSKIEKPQPLKATKPTKPAEVKKKNN